MICINMPQRTKEERKEYQRLYKLKNIEKHKEYAKLYRKEHRDKYSEYNREYYNNHINYFRKYKQSEGGKKSQRIAQWKHYGILCFDFDLLYDIFLKTTHCELCNVKLTVDRQNTKTTKCMDHDHSITDKFNVRYVLCNSCNVKLK